MTMIDNDKLTRWYDLQARFYSAWRDNPSGAHVAALLGLLDAETNLAVLDVGCGTGLFSIALAEASPRWQVTGLDASKGMLAVARANADKRNVERLKLERGNAYTLPFDDDSFDVVNASGLLPNLDNHPRAMAEFRRVLRPGGLLTLVEVDRKALEFKDRLFFRTMILGYRIASTILPRYKFARGWNLQKTTIDPDATAKRLQSAGFTLGGCLRGDKHWILHSTL
jgi:ubiquinone/menaquinone biosynthesis C-methylase UbiE